MTARESLKKILNRMGFGFLLVFLRSLRFFGYAVIDVFGWALLGLPIYLLRRRVLKAEEIKKILIIRLDRVGDVVLSTPAIRAVRENYPNSRIDLLVAKYTKDLVIGNRNVDRVIIHKETELDKDYDVAIALHPGLVQNYLVFKSGAVWRVGYSGWGGSFFLTHRVKDDRAARVRHEVISALEVVGRVGCTTKDVSLEVSQTPEGNSEARAFLDVNGIKPGEPYVVVHPGARQEHIRWHHERFAKVADRIARECGLKVILTGGALEAGLVRQVKSLMRQQAACATGLSLTGIVSLLKGSKIFIGNSTGPMHIAAALQIPVVAIISIMHPLDSLEVWGPWGTTSIVLHKDTGCKKCQPGNCLSYECLDQVSVEEVYGAVLSLLNKK